MRPHLARSHRSPASPPPLLSLALAALLAGCSADAMLGPSPPGSDGGVVDGAGTIDASPGVKVSFEPCNLHSEGDGPDAECATLDVPLDYASPGGATIPFYVKRYHPPGGAGRFAFWMLQGGPGGSGYAFERFAELVATRFPDVDFYIPDHRGTGRSSMLTCSAQADDSDRGIEITLAEWPACIDEVKKQWGAGLAHFTTSNAARDVARAAKAMRAPGQRVYIMGGSYGTYWAARLLQIEPGTFDGYVLDSFVPPGSSLARQDQDADEAARDFLAACGRDPGCSSHLGPDPVALARDVFARLDKGHCGALRVPPFLTGSTLATAFRLAFGSLLMQQPYRALIFPVVRRLDRCDAGDVAALQRFLNNVYTPSVPGEFLLQFSFVLSNNIAFSELWEEPSPTVEQLAAYRQGVASREITVNMVQERALWPLYPPDEYVGKWPDDTRTPVLVLAGGFDPATLIRKARVATDHFTGPGRLFVEVPGATHFVMASSPTNDKRSCGTRIAMSFLEDPLHVDQSCLGDLVPTVFEPDATLSRSLFGKSNPWD